MSIQIKYTCGTCGISLIKPEMLVEGIIAKDSIRPRVVEKIELWHECNDGYVVPLQSEVEKAPNEPKKKDHK